MNNNKKSLENNRVNLKVRSIEICSLRYSCKTCVRCSLKQTMHQSDFTEFNSLWFIPGKRMFIPIEQRRNEGADLPEIPDQIFAVWHYIKSFSFIACFVFESFPLLFVIISSLAFFNAWLVPSIIIAQQRCVFTSLLSTIRIKRGLNFSNFRHRWWAINRIFEMCSNDCIIGIFQYFVRKFVSVLPDSTEWILEFQY